MKKSTLAIATLLTALASVPVVSIAYADDATTTNSGTTSSEDAKDTQGTSEDGKDTTPTGDESTSDEGEGTSSDH